jgi:hypothetical protein
VASPATVTAQAGAPAAPAPPPPVAPTPPSPVAAEKPPTPKDTADSGDKVLATVAPPEPPKTADRAQRTVSRTVSVSVGLIELQTPVAPRGPGGAVAGQRISMTGALFGRW